MDKEVYLIVTQNEYYDEDESEFYYYLVEKEVWDKYIEMSKNDIDAAVEYVDLYAGALKDSDKMSVVTEYIKENNLTLMCQGTWKTEY